MLAVTLAGHATAAKPPSAPLAPNVMALEGVMPDLSSTLRLMNGIDNVAQYLSDPNTVCTVFIPTNEVCLQHSQPSCWHRRQVLSTVVLAYVQMAYTAEPSVWLRHELIMFCLASKDTLAATSVAPACSPLSVVTFLASHVHYYDAVRHCTLTSTQSNVLAVPRLQANTISIQRLGRYVGLAAQNETLQNDTYNYHIIPGRALTAADLMDIDQVVTREGETLDIWHKG